MDTQPMIAVYATALRSMKRRRWWISPRFASGYSVVVRMSTNIQFVLLIRLKSLALVGAATVAIAASAGEFHEKEGVAIGGYDPVAYFTHAYAVKGSPEYKAEHRGSLFRFASKANRDAFVLNPAKYAPQYDGYCAFTAAGGYKVAADPAVFAVVNDRLYLHRNKDVQHRWRANIPSFIAQADKAWSDISLQGDGFKPAFRYDDPHFVVPIRRKRNELYL